MGEAKRRGAYDKRKQEGIEAAERAKNKRLQRDLDEWSALIPQERERRLKMRSMITNILAIAGGI